MIIDLCCGRGRFDFDEEVISVDMDPKTKPDIVADIRYLPFKPGMVFFQSQKMGDWLAS